MSHNHIFKYEDLSYKFESSMLETNNQLLANKKGGPKAKLGKRLCIDYDFNVNQRNGYKLQKNEFQKNEFQKNGQIISYKNFDLQYSTWYDSITKNSENNYEMNENQVACVKENPLQSQKDATGNPVVKISSDVSLQDPYNCYSNSLLIDMNDRNVLYDRLNSFIKPGATDKNDPNYENFNNQNLNDLDSDDGGNMYENDKINMKNLKEKNGIKTLNQYKKALR